MEFTETARSAFDSEKRSWIFNTQRNNCVEVLNQNVQKFAYGIEYIRKFGVLTLFMKSVIATFGVTLEEEQQTSLLDIRFWPNEHFLADRTVKCASKLSLSLILT